MKRPRLSKSGVINPDAEKKRADKWLIAREYRGEPVKSAIGIYIRYNMPIPRSFSKKRKKQAQENDIFHVSKPDIDNMIKHTLDVLSGLVFQDDSQVQSITARKVYSDHPSTEIRIFLDEE